MEAAKCEMPGRGSPARYAIVYAVCSIVWIVLSDHVVTAVFPDRLLHLQTVKGLLFVVVTAGVLYVLMVSFQRREERALEAKRAAERKFRSMIEDSFELVAVLDAGGRAVYRSPGYERALGYTPDDLVEERVFGRVHPDDLEAVRRKFLERPAAPGQVSETIEFRMRSRDGAWRVFEGTATNLLDDPAVRGTVVNMRDITDRKSLERRALSAQRMEAVGQLASGVAHDFNNLLMIIEGYSQAVANDLAEDDPHGKSLREVVKAVAKAKVIARKLLSLGRDRGGGHEIVDLDAVIGEMADMIGRVVSRGGSIEVEIVPGAERLPVRVNPGEFEQVVLNLVVNARDAMPDGGVLRIETTCATFEVPRLTGGTIVDPGSYVVVAVSDTGTGMDQRTRQRIFEPFFTSKGRGEGTGLGLTMVDRIVREHAGCVAVESAPGEGTMFQVFLPLAEAGARGDRNREGGRTVEETAGQALGS